MESYLQKAMLYIGVGLWALYLVVAGNQLQEGFWKPLGFVSLALTVFSAVYGKWAWSWFPLNKLSGIPDLRGTWRGHLESSWVNPETNEKSADIEAYFVIWQTASTVEVTMFTKESHSHTVVAKLELRDGIFQIVGTYRNDPGTQHRKRSQMHYGGLILRVGGPPPTTIEGDYWTDRTTSGAIHIERFSEALVSDFKTAQALCGSQSPAKPSISPPEGEKLLGPVVTPGEEASPQASETQPVQGSRKD